METSLVAGNDSFTRPGRVARLLSPTQLSPGIITLDPIFPTINQAPSQAPTRPLYQYAERQRQFST